MGDFDLVDGVENLTDMRIILDILTKEKPDHKEVD